MHIGSTNYTTVTGVSGLIHRHFHGNRLPIWGKNMKEKNNKKNQLNQVLFAPFTISKLLIAIEKKNKQNETSEIKSV